MVNKKKALKVSLLSAGAVGIVHYVGHLLAPTILPNNQVLFVGSVVVLSVFGIGYFGMISK
jgi:hypothetical protein